MYDIENQKYLDQDPDNIIFLYSLKNNNEYYAFGYNKRFLAYNIETDVFYDCDQDIGENYFISNYEYNKLIKKSMAYIKINIPYTALVLAEEILSLINSQTRLFLLKKSNKKILRSISYGVLFANMPDNTSSYHCQKDSGNEVYTLYTLSSE